MDFADWFWIIWLAGGLVIAEGLFAIFKSEWTFSVHVWKWFAIGKKWSENWAGLRWILLVGLLVSTLLHLAAFTSVVPVIVFAFGALWSIWYHYRYEAKT